MRESYYLLLWVFANGVIAILWLMGTVGIGDLITAAAAQAVALLPFGMALMARIFSSVKPGRVARNTKSAPLRLHVAP